MWELKLSFYPSAGRYKINIRETLYYGFCPALFLEAKARHYDAILLPVKKILHHATIPGGKSA